MADSQLLASGALDFSRGMNSAANPSRIGEMQYAMGMNVVSRGGVVQTRPGFTTMFNLPCGRLQGFTMFQPNDLPVHWVAVVDGFVYVSAAPFNTFTRLNGIRFWKRSRFVAFASCVQTTFYDSGILSLLDRPKNVLIMQDGNTRAAMWDGNTARHLNPTLSRVFDENGDRITMDGLDETPIGLWMAWAGNRLWVSRGKYVFASDIGNPTKFTETQYIAEGRAFTMPEDVTGMIQPASGDNLIVFGRESITFLAANIQDRRQWLSTPNFQRSEYGIGCIAPRSIVNKLGLTWWYSASGWTNLNFALSSFNDSKLRYLDEPMQASKSYLSPDKAGICAGEIENYILVSVPSGSRFNRHTWALDLYQDEAIVWDGIWTGINPVEWARASINGVDRIFCASRDSDGINRVWEAFREDRTDNGEPITSFVLTRSDAMGTKDLKRFRYAELYLDDVYGIVDFYAGVAGRKGGFRRVLTKRMNAAVGPLNLEDIYYSEDQGENEKTIWHSNRPQGRVIRTEEIYPEGEDTCNTCGVESDIPFPIDREFQMLLMWSGRASVEGYRLYADEQSRLESRQGRCEDDETGTRTLNEGGCSGLTAYVGEQALTLFESNQEYEASCSEGETGGSVIVGAYSTSYISQADADRRAAGKARLLALGTLVCVENIVLADENEIALADETGTLLTDL